MNQPMLTWSFLLSWKLLHLTFWKLAILHIWIFHQTVRLERCFSALLWHWCWYFLKILYHPSLWSFFRNFHYTVWESMLGNWLITFLLCYNAIKLFRSNKNCKSWELKRWKNGDWIDFKKRLFLLKRTVGSCAQDAFSGRKSINLSTYASTKRTFLQKVTPQDGRLLKDK